MYRMKFYLDIASILVTASVVARVGYYVVYGKEGGAGPLPRRNETSKKN